MCCRYASYAVVGICDPDFILQWIINQLVLQKGGSKVGGGRLFGAIWGMVGGG